jgi:hypothetical protein
METALRFHSLSLRQQRALGYINSPKIDSLHKVIDILSKHDEEVTPPLLRRLIKAAIKKGDPTTLRNAYLYFAEQNVPVQEYLRCAKSAVRNLDPYAAIHAYKAAAVEIPKVPLRKIGVQLLNQCASEKFSLQTVLYIYKGIDEQPDSVLTAVLSNAIKKRYNMREHKMLCEFLNQDMDKDFLEKCITYWESQLSYGGIANTAELLGKKLSKPYLRSMGKKAFAAGKEEDGENFFKAAY